MLRLLTEAVAAVDGSKFTAVSNRNETSALHILPKRTEQIDVRITPGQGARRRDGGAEQCSAG